MSKTRTQFAGGALPHAGSNGEVCSGSASGALKARNSAIGGSQRRDSESARVPGRADSPLSGRSNRTNCLPESAERCLYIALDEVDLSPEEKSACSGIAGFVFGEVERCHGHFHIAWECPDCGGTGFGGYDGEPVPMQCEVTGRYFLIAGLDQRGATP